MESALRQVIRLPLSELWDDKGPRSGSRVRNLFRQEVKELCISGGASFVFAEVGKPLRWTNYSITDAELRDRVLPRIVESEPIRLEECPDEIAYVASLWDSGPGDRIVLLEVFH